MSEVIEVSLISLCGTLLGLLIGNSYSRQVDRNKNIKEDFFLIINENKDIFKIILDINRNVKDINYYDLRKKLEQDKSNILFLYDKKMGKLFSKLYVAVNKNGSELKNNIDNIRKISKKIVRRIQKIGGKAYGINYK